MWHWRLGALVVAAALVASACNYVYGPFLTRVDGPVVVTAADLGVESWSLDPGRGLAYRWDPGAAQWVQIPIQIDERVVVDFGVKPNSNVSPGVAGSVYGSGNLSGVTHLQYADANTWVGADPDATFDADDELVFLARDAGPQAPAGTAHPPAAIGGIGREIELVDPDGGTPGYVYLFYGGAGVDPSAGVDHVTYDFVLDAGDYKDDYKRADGPNPESSTVTTDRYMMGLSDRWITDEMRSNYGTGVDILDGHKSRFSFSTCGRSNATFADAEGAFVANIDGPIRAVRSYIGANSGPLTQRTEIFYEDRYDQITDLRVHSIGGVMSFWDYSAAAIGMEYGSSTIAGTVTVDGVPETLPTAVPDWSYVVGPQANVSTAADFSGTYVPTVEAVWLDDSTPPYAECWGDGDFFGANGAAIVSPIPNTDPRSSPFLTFRSRQVSAFWPVGLDMEWWTPLWANQVLQDLDITVTNF